MALDHPQATLKFHPAPPIKPATEHEQLIAEVGDLLTPFSDSFLRQIRDRLSSLPEHRQQPRRHA